MPSSASAHQLVARDEGRDAHEELEGRGERPRATAKPIGMRMEPRSKAGDVHVVTSSAELSSSEVTVPRQ